jgi:hypothetical protein
MKMDPIVTAIALSPLVYIVYFIGVVLALAPYALAIWFVVWLVKYVTRKDTPKDKSDV